MKRAGLVIALAAVLAAPSFAQEWAGRGRVQGTITDEQGKPIEGARVTLKLGEGGPAPATTNNKGKWTMLGLAHGDWTVIVEAPGFVGSEGSVKIYESGPGQSLSVSLRKPTAAEVAAADPAQQKAQESVEMLKAGNALIEQKKYAEARAEYEKALAGLPTEHHAPVLRAIANAYYAEGNAEQAIVTFEKAIALAPTDAELIQALVNVLVAEGREADAEKYAARLPQGVKMDPNALLNVGIEAYNAGDVEKAFTYFDRVVRENESHPDGYFYRALANLNRGDNAAAKADLEKFLAMAPSHDKAAEAKEFLQQLQ